MTLICRFLGHEDTVLRSSALASSVTSKHVGTAYHNAGARIDIVANDETPSIDLVDRSAELQEPRICAESTHSRTQAADAVISANLRMDSKKSLAIPASEREMFRTRCMNKGIVKAAGSARKRTRRGGDGRDEDA